MPEARRPAAGDGPVRQGVAVEIGKWPRRAGGEGEEGRQEHGPPPSRAAEYDIGENGAPPPHGSAKPSPWATGRQVAEAAPGPGCWLLEPLRRPAWLL